MPEAAADFKAWFGASQVALPDGTPRPVFHGTQAAFDAFDMGMLGVNTPLAVSKLGAFFSGTRTSPRALYARMDHSKPGRVITAFLALRNPAVIGAAEFYSHVTPDQVESLRTRLLASGHDGIIVKGGRKFHNADHFVAFEAAQIHIVQTCAAQPVRSRTGPGASAVLARAWIDSQEPPLTLPPTSKRARTPS